MWVMDQNGHWSWQPDDPKFYLPVLTLSEFDVERIANKVLEKLAKRYADRTPGCD